MRSRALVVGLAVTTAAVVGAPPAVAAPTTVTACGSVVSGAAVLAADLRCAGGTGVTLTDGASLDLRGHRLLSDGNGVGVVLAGGGDAVVRDGVVEGWGAGARVAPGEGTGPGGTVHVRRVTFRDDEVGIEVVGFEGVVPAVRIRSSRFEGNGTALLGQAAAPISVTSSRLTDNRAAVEAHGTSVTVRRSVLARNLRAVQCDGARCHVSRSVLTDNGTAVGASWDGVVTLRRTVLARNDVGLDSYSVGAGTHLLVGNVWRDNVTAVRLITARATLVGNRFVGNELGFTAESWEGDAYTASLERNTFVRNGDGVRRVVAGSTLRANTAAHNTGRGLHAAGAVDLGGNRAWGNGTEPQCVGVVCAPRP